MHETAARTAPSVATGRVSLGASGYNANGSMRSKSGIIAP